MARIETDTWRERVGRLVDLLGGAGAVHGQRLDNVDIRIAVTGVRGKSTTVRWLHDIFHERGYDTYAKATGTTPVSIYNGTERLIDRYEQVRLYENERELRRHGPVDVAIFENQGIREYTTRLVNERYVDPDVVFLTNVREDHLGTLGNGRIAIARSLARAVPEGARVINAEQDPKIRRYLERELDRRDATVTHVELPPETPTAPGIECIYGLNDVLTAVDESPIDDERVEAYRRRVKPTWTELPGGKVHNAADVNDVQSTDLVRRSLAGGETPIEPVLFLRGDRRGRTASFVRYLTHLAENDVVEQAHVMGDYARLFARRSPFPVTVYDVEEDPPATVLDEALASGRPVVLMGNTVDEYMDDMEYEIQCRVAANEWTVDDADHLSTESGDRWW